MTYLAKGRLTGKPNSFQMVAEVKVRKMQSMRSSPCMFTALNMEGTTQEGILYGFYKVRAGLADSQQGNRDFRTTDSGNCILPIT